MAKKSAAGKGYRKTVKKEAAGLNKKEIIIASVIIGVALIGLILFAVLYNDGSLETQDGVLNTEGTNSLILNDSHDSHSHYYKLGQLADVENYTLTSDAVGSDENVRYYSYAFAGEGEPAIRQVLVDTNATAAKEYADLVYADYSASEGFVTTEVQSSKVSGHDVYSVITGTGDAESEDIIQLLTACVAIDDHSVVFTMINDSAALTDAELLDAAQPFLNALSYETK